MPRIGELLVATGELTATQIEHALRAQVAWGGRLGTNLVELGYIDLDQLAEVLSRQHRLPAAFARHFEHADAEVQRKLSPDIAERYSCIPLLFAGPRRSKLIIASIAPIDKKGIAIIADDMGIAPEQVTQSVAGELRVRYHLERVYGIPRGTRFLRSRGKSIPPFPQFEIDPLAFEDSQVDTPVPVMPRAPSPEPAYDEDAVTMRLEALGFEMEDDTIPLPTSVEDGRERRTYVRTLDAPPPSESASLGRISIKRRPGSAPVVAVEESPSENLTLAEATRAIRRSVDRDRVAALVGEALQRFMPSCEAAQMLVIRGDAAIGWRGFSRSGKPVPELAVPLDQPGLIPRVIERVQTCRSASGDLGPIDQLLLVSLGAITGELVIVPIAISNQVICVIALATHASASTAAAESVAIAAGTAFARLMRNASR